MSGKMNIEIYKDKHDVDRPYCLRFVYEDNAGGTVINLTHDEMLELLEKLQRWAVGSKEADNLV